MYTSRSGRSTVDIWSLIRHSHGLFQFVSLALLAVRIFFHTQGISKSLAVSQLCRWT